MTFLQPYILWALPLVLVPVVIHLINRLRHRPQPWAAMRFLVSATRSSISHAKLRQYLVLLFRVLAVLMLILFLSRPLAGGWLGWALSPAPDAILILLDRSASMETTVPGSTVTRREQALKLLTDAVRGFEGSSHVVVIDSALRLPTEVSAASQLSGLSVAMPTDTAADLPAMLQTAVQWLVENRAGTAEIWIASDLQRSNWTPEDPRWKTVTTQIASLPQKVRVRLLAFGGAPSSNTSLALAEMVRRRKPDGSELQLAVDFLRPGGPAESLPVNVSLDGVGAQQELAMDGTAMRWRHRVDLGNRQGGGWGSITVPADGNRRDNTAYFVYGPETPLRAVVVSEDPVAGRYLQLAVSALTGEPMEARRILNPTAFNGADLAGVTLIAWQGSLPEEAAAARVREFVGEGGAAVFFPSGTAEGRRLNGVAWGEVQSAGPEAAFKVMRWDEEQGPLARTDEGTSLPLNLAGFQRRQLLLSPKASLAILAAFDDGTPLLGRQTSGKGELYFCASLPHPDWSTLGLGPVLVPMTQRLLITGSRRLQQASLLTAGEVSAAEANRSWTTVDDTARKDIRLHAGVYRSGDRLAAVNRPAAEDEVELMESGQAEKLFVGLPFQMLQEKRAATDALQGEIWRVLLIVMLAFLIVEGLLILPAPVPAAAGAAGAGVRVPPGPAAEVAR